MRETQRTVGEWARETFNERTIAHRAKMVLEEAVELCMTSYGMTPASIKATVLATIKKTKRQSDYTFGTTQQEEAADVYINLMAYANHSGFDLEEALERKMAKNRSRPKEYYQQKQAAKKAMGM